MPTINFFVRARKMDRLSSIRCRLRDGANFDAYAHTGYTILPNHWSQAKQAAKNIATFPEKDELNKNLRSLRNYILDQYTEALKGTPKEWLQEVINNFHNPQLEHGKNSLFAFIRDFIDKAETRASPSTGRPVSYKMRREYERTFYYLMEFSKSKKRQIDFNDVTLDFYHDFIAFLQSEKIKVSTDGKVEKVLGLAQNTIGKKIQTLKIFLNAASDEGLNAYQHFKSHRFIAPKEETDHVYLNETEIWKIFNLDLSKNPRLDKIRDLFIVGCWTGLRFSDWDQVKTSNIEVIEEDERLLRVKQTKTGGEIYIPFHPMANAILEKYAGILPHVPSNQKCNEYLKEVMQLAKIDGLFQKTITKGGVTRTTSHKKWEVVGTHTARRSFATNLYNAGVPSLTIMQITGHRTESAFLKYIKVTPKEHALKLAKIWKDNRQTIIRKIS